MRASYVVVITSASVLIQACANSQISNVPTETASSLARSTPRTTPTSTPTPTPTTTTTPTPAPTGKTYEVGAGRQYATLSQVADLVSPGDQILIYGGATYAGQRFARAGSAQNKIFVRGVRDSSGNRPIISGGTNTIEVAADHYVFEGLQITGGSSRCFFHHADDVTIRDTKIFSCPAHGILSADQDSGSLTLEYVEVTSSGSGTSQHPIYVTSDQSAHPGSVFRIRNSYIHDNNGGNAIKSRAERNEIYYNWIDASLYHALELIGPDFDSGVVNPALKREDSDVVGNVIRQPKSFYAVRVGGDKVNSESKGRYRLVNNTFIIGGTSAVLRPFLGVETLEVHNNAFVKTGANIRIIDEADVIWTSGRRVSGQKNWISTGSTSVPADWTNTITTADPGFVNLAGLDLRLTASSPLLNAGVAQPATITGFEFPNPNLSPNTLPPMRTIEPLGQALLRILSPGQISIGAFER